MDWFAFGNIDSKTKREIQTHIRHFLVYNELNEKQVKIHDVANRYLWEIEKPEYLMQYFLPPTFDMLTELYSFIQMEFKLNNVKTYLSIEPDVSKLGITLKKEASEKQKRYVRKLCNELKMKVDYEHLSSNECRFIINRLTELKTNKEQSKNPA